MNAIQERLHKGLAGRYTLDRELGHGGMAVVFLARDLRHDRSVALKVLRPEVSAEIGAERFLREIKLAAGLTHPHILPVYDSGEADGLLFYVMPNMEGRSLRERLDTKRQLPLDEALRVSREVASALDYAHRHQVVHRDIKPENILLHEGSAMVADFGIGKALSSGRSITQTGLAVGTPAYMSPEQAGGDADIDGRSDLYSLGCVLYEMLTGEPPSTGPTAQAIIAKRFVSPVPRVRTTRDVPDTVDETVMRALSRTPVDRFPTAAAFADALLQISRPDGAPSGRLEVQKSGPSRTAIAVLPLSNMSADPENEYFSDGMTEEIISRLARLGRMRVVSRTSAFAFKGKNEDVRRIGERLEVASVLEGSVRKIGNRLRVTAQLIDVGTGYDLWSETYDRTMDDAFAVQDDITRAIVDRLKVRLLEGDAERVATREPVPANAYNEYLRGRFLWNQRTSDSLLKSVGCFERAIAEAPTYALAHAGLADAYNMLGFYEHLPPRDAFPRAQAAARHALELDDKLGEAHAALAYSQFYFDWKFADAEQSLTRATELNPGYAIAYHYLGNLMASRQRFDESAAAFRKALTLDPLSLIINSGYSWSLYQAGRYEDALDQVGRALELDARFMLAHFWYGLILLALGRSGESIAPLERAVELSSRAAFVVAALAYASAKTGDSTRARSLLEEVTSAKHAYVPSFDVALVYLALGETQPAVQNLERALEERSHSLVFLGSDARVAPLLSDPRVQAIRRVVDG